VNLPEIANRVDANFDQGVSEFPEPYLQNAKLEEKRTWALYNQDQEVTDKKERRPLSWYIGMTTEFLKSISDIDRKLQGRILQAIATIVKNPFQQKGDTIKPLIGALKGCWRIRIGEYRLIYKPDGSTGYITLLAFDARGSVYED